MTVPTQQHWFEPLIFKRQSPIVTFPIAVPKSFPMSYPIPIFFEPPFIKPSLGMKAVAPVPCPPTTVAVIQLQHPLYLTPPLVTDIPAEHKELLKLLKQA